MAKRKLTQHQLRRISHRQKAGEKRAETAKAIPNDDLLGPEKLGIVISNYGAFADVKPWPEADDKQHVLKCYLRANIGDLVTGDKVVWRAIDHKQGVITALSPRQSLLHRYNTRGQTQLIGANIDTVITVIACEPEPFAWQLDRYIAASELAGLDTLIVVNKVDLLDKSMHEKKLKAMMINYLELNYPIIECSGVTGQGLPELIDLLTSKASIMIGQSGVGKSSLINALAPHAEQKTGQISQETHKGRHTTTTSRLIDLPQHGLIIDSPGIREFSLGPLDVEQLSQGFIEFKPFLGLCKFRNCQHQQEPGCRIKKAVKQEKISEQRFQSFQFLCRTAKQTS